MHNLELLEINQDLEKYPLPNSLGLIPSQCLTKINITTEIITMTGVEYLLEQVNYLKAKSTYVSVKSEKLKGIRMNFYTNTSKLVKKEIRKFFNTELSRSDK
jgi:hypothetical protein